MGEASLLGGCFLLKFRAIDVLVFGKYVNGRQELRVVRVWGRSHNPFFRIAREEI